MPRISVRHGLLICLLLPFAGCGGDDAPASSEAEIAIANAEKAVAEAEAIAEKAVTEKAAAEKAAAEAVAEKAAAEAVENDPVKQFEKLATAQKRRRQVTLGHGTVSAATAEELFKSELVAAVPVTVFEEEEHNQDRGRAALTELFEDPKYNVHKIIVKRVVTDIVEMFYVRMDRMGDLYSVDELVSDENLFDWTVQRKMIGWQDTTAGVRGVKGTLRKILGKYKIHKDKELSDRVYGYIRKYYSIKKADFTPLAVAEKAAAEYERKKAAAEAIAQKPDVTIWSKTLSQVVSVEFDVRKTDSLVSPFTGHITVKSEQIPFMNAKGETEFQTEAEARAANRHKPVATIADSFRGESGTFHFAYQDNKWVYKYVVLETELDDKKRQVTEVFWPFTPIKKAGQPGRFTRSTVLLEE